MILKFWEEKLRKGKWRENGRKRGKKWKDREMNEVREKLGFSVPIILRSNYSAAFRHLGRRDTGLKTKL